MVPPDAIGGALKSSGTGRAAGFSGERYRGVDEAGGRIEVVWLPQFRLPAYLKRSHGREQTEFRLRRIRHIPSAAIESSVADYVRLDYADLDDNPADPFFRRLAQSEHAGGAAHR